MTISSPNHDRQLSYVMRWLFVGIIAAAVVSIGIYNKTVALRRAVAAGTQRVEQLKLKNAELKNTYFSSLDNRTLVSVVERLGYVRDNTPLYLTFRADGTAVQDGPAVSLRN